MKKYILLLVALFGLTACSNVSQEDYDTATSQIEEYKAQIADLENSKVQWQTVQAEKEELETELQEAKTEVKSLEDKVKTLTNENEEVKKELKLVQEKLEAAKLNNFVEAKVVQIIDGDTIEVSLDGKNETVRLIGIDTPETKHPEKGVEYFGQEATDYTRSQVDGKTVYLEQDVSERDQYGRLLMYVWLVQDIDSSKVSAKDIETKQLNGLLVANGYAQSSTYPPDVKYKDHYQELSQTAREKEVGLWENKAETAVASQSAGNNYDQQPTALVSTVEESSEERQEKPQEAPDEPVYRTSSYIGNANTGKFHHSHCSSVDQMNESNKVSLSSRGEAVNQGYVPCKRCNP